MCTYYGRIEAICVSVGIPDFEPVRGGRRTEGRSRFLVSSNCTKDRASGTPGVILSSNFAENSISDERFLCFSADEPGTLVDSFLEVEPCMKRAERPLSFPSTDCRRKLPDRLPEV